ncbi:exonuclease SbcCD subunit D [Candidatus Woesearchaeota archaeon]|nr:exonuclease SbcCD subunit D [Candidatus Woesearchaeota archaeon]
MTNMKFAHLADCHLGGWREPALREANTQSFAQAITHCLDEKVDFVIVAGDLFNTAVPSIDVVHFAVEQFRRLRDAGTPVYVIAGSHDYSPAGKTLLDVLESAGLCKNVAVAEGGETLRLVPTIDPKTNTVLCGMPGRKGGLDAAYYENMDASNVTGRAGYKIFVFHNAISELKPEELADMDAMAISSLPKGFDYYAGGHVHIVQQSRLEGYNVVYPGPVFPNNIAELEKLECGSVVIVDNGQVKHQKILLHPVLKIALDCTNKAASDVESLVKGSLRNAAVQNSIVVLRLAGILSQGKLADIPLSAIVDGIHAQGAYCVLRNTTALQSPETAHVAVKTGTVEDVEQEVVAETPCNLAAFPKDAQSAIVQSLMAALGAEKEDGEKAADYEKRMTAALCVLDVEKLLL